VVDDYLDSFLTLVSDAGYTNPRTLVVKFHWGLKSNIQSQITTMPFGWPTDTNPEAWYTAAWRIDQAQLINKAFQSMLQSTTMAPMCSTLSWSTPFLMFCLSQSTLPSIPLRPALPVPSRGIPMDVDTVWKACSLPPWECYQCGKTNHLVRDCSHCLDV